jgi:GNAT superfamily N-acetyltransferase
MTLSFDPAILDRHRLYAWLREAYWSAGRPQDSIDRSLEDSLCLSAWDGDEMVGFARVVTDYATFAWLCDVIVAPDRRGQGIGKTMVAAILAREDLATVRWMLGTRDAHTLYEQFGFETSVETDRWMTKGFNVRPPRS